MLTLLAALAQDECPPCPGGVSGHGEPMAPRWEEGLAFRGPTAPPNPRGEPCAWLPDRDDAAKDHVACSPRAADVVRAWSPDLPGHQSTSIVWVDGLDVTAVWAVPVRHWSEVPVRSGDPRDGRDGARCVVRTVVGADGVPLVASARCGSTLHEDLALARRYCACDGTPIVMDTVIRARSP